MLDFDVLGKIIEDKVIYVRTDTDIGDFTQDTKAVLQIYGKTLRAELALAERELVGIVNALVVSLFAEGKTIIFWDIKPFATYFRYRAKNNLEIKANVFDLRIIESFMGIKQKPPTSWQEAVRRFQDCINPKAMNIHKKIHLPLALNVIPDLETTKISGNKYIKKLVSSYEIEGITTGRLRCTQPTPAYLNPHTLDREDEQIAGLIPPYGHELFAYFDFKNMEVSMLQYFSKDEALGEIMADPTKDVYVEIYKRVTGFQEVNAQNARHTAKSFFLPIVYGQGPNSLVESLGIDEATAKELHSTTIKKFPGVFSWVEEQHRTAEQTMMVMDYFGRTRIFEEKMYRARHFVIAAPASVICMEKLIELHKEAPKTVKLLWSIHDGYYLTAPSENYRKTCDEIKLILERPSQLCPGFSLKVSCSLGKSLKNMHKLF